MSFTRRAALVAALSTLAIAWMAPAASAHSYKIGDLEIGHPWTRATPPGAKVAGGYLSITNNGAGDDTLVSASFTQSGTTELHEMTHEKGVMKMRELPKGITISPGAQLTLQPGGFHLMFITLKAGLKAGESFKGTLVFEKAGRIDVEFKVEPMNHRPKSSGAEHDHSAHGAKAR